MVYSESMSSLSSDEIKHLAELTRISLSDEELMRFEVEMPKIVKFVEELGEANTAETVEQKTISLEHLRSDDEVSNKLTLDELASLAPEWRHNQVEVPGVFESSDE